MKVVMFLSVVLLNTSNFTIPELPFKGTHLSLDTIIEHGGGCRKSSPPGQCCHAGSKPLHCH